jgi:L-alanine-DL-glutamate epimerase-like enolase superfamily enzyme
MHIEKISVYIVRAPLGRAYWMSLEPYSEASEIVIELRTSEGLTGIGEIHGRPMEKIVEIIRDAFAPLLIGRDPLETEAIYNSLFQCTCTRQGARLNPSSGQPHFGGGARPQIMAAIAGIDIALWDLKGKLLGQPVWRLLGGGNSIVAAYASGGYYGPEGEAAIDGLVEEMGSYAALGYPTIKMKVGGLPIAADVERLRAVRDCVGPDVSILLDANQAYDVPTAIAAAHAFHPYGIGWFEEPVHWYDSVFGLAQVSRAIDIPTASGESEMHRWGCRDLIEHAGIRIMQFDCTRAGGVTEWLKVAAYAAAHGVAMAPHHDAQIHGHLVAAVPNGYILEVFPNPLRDPLWEELFTGRPKVTNGVLRLPDSPGFGFGLNSGGMRKYATQFC